MITVFFLETDSINRTYTVLFEELRRRSEPDLCVVDVGSLTPDEVSRLCGTSDAVVIDHFVYIASRMRRDIISSVVCQRSPAPGRVQACLDAILGSRRPIMFVASGWDLHWPGVELEDLLARIHAIAWLYEKAPIAFAEIPACYRDPWMVDHTDALKNWRRIIDRVPVRVELVHSLAEDEFLGRAQMRLWDACIAGAHYETRALAVNSAQRAGVSVAPFRRADNCILKATERLSRFIPPPSASRLRNYARQVNQRWFVRRSRLSFVCGSGYRYFVRKFVEIPACQTPMLCYPCVGFEDYGFRDGTNAICLAPEDFGPTARRVLAGGRAIDQLVRNAFETVRRLHSVSARVDGLLECLRRFSRDELRNAQYIGGEFIVQ